MSIALKFNGILVTGISKIDTITKTTVNLVNTVSFKSSYAFPASDVYYLTAVDACTGMNTHIDVYASVPVLSNGVTIYADTGLNTIFSTASPYIYTTGYSFTISSGVISNYTACASDTTPPTAPTTVSANLSGGTVLVTWSGATDNVGIDSYEVWYSTDAVTYSLLDSAFSESYIDNFYSSGWNYYKIKTVDTSGNKSPFSSVASIFM